MLTTADQMVVRPVRLVSCWVPSPRNSQVVTTPDSVTAAEHGHDADRPANSLRTRDFGRDQAQAGDEDAEHHREQRGPGMRQQRMSTAIQATTAAWPSR